MRRNRRNAVMVIDCRSRGEHVCVSVQFKKCKILIKWWEYPGFFVQSVYKKSIIKEYFTLFVSHVCC